MTQFPIILFDGICNLCCGWIQFVIRRDKEQKFRFASLQSESGIRLLNSIGLATGSPESIVYLKGSNHFFESSAVLEILYDIGGIWRLFILFKLIPPFIRDSVYRFIANRRYFIFGSRGSCYLPSSENQKRFLP